MISRLSLRTRLTMFVTLTFAVAISLISVLVLDRIEDGLVSDTRASAEAVLADYLDSINGGVATLGIVDDEVGTQFFYRDADGQPLSEPEYFRLIASALDAEFRQILDSAAVPLTVGSTVLFDGGVELGPLPSVAGPIVIDDSTGELLAPDGGLITFAQGPVPVGEPQSVALGADVVGVSQTLVLSNGTEFEVGVTSPLRPVTDSLDAVKRVGWFAIPLLVLAIGGVTWLAATRALSPVHAISSRARAISAASLDQRLPVPSARDEIRELADTVNAMLDRIQTSQERQQRLVADASHELRSPVAASRAQLEVAGANPDTTDWARTGAIVLAEQERLSDLIDDLLALSRMDESGTPGGEIVDLFDVVEAEAARPLPVPVDVVARSSQRVDVTGDRRLIIRAVRNLVDNACRHADQTVRVTLGRSESMTTLHVDDDGPGVPETERSRIFERFARLDESRNRNDGGAGLGLAIAREVSRGHGGDLVCDTSPLGGARMTLTLPATPE